jgi:hypothetical protein
MAWYENYTKEEMPPEHIWEDTEGLDEWFERVRERRGLPPSSSSDSNETEELDDNEFARVFKEK